MKLIYQRQTFKFDIPCLKSKLDWILKYKQSEIDKIMKDNAVHIHFPLVKDVNGSVKFSGETLVYVKRAVRLFHDLVIYSGSF